ncbi:DUF7269 family protein [Halomarina oriensis]|uniref:Uncharacterized protein n=1 Tax=Halomarina oriensis TaxID=671145 RepID=A0A6B0GS02_9EURY|nr:hypothetical protein [Halomarina oriensis]MWG36931.1 hypothetical protein [Halomarina oriensis]
MRWRTALGVVAVLVGLAAAGGLVDVGLPALFVPLVGVVAVLIAAGAVRDSLSADDRPVLPEPERRHAASVPGDEFDTLLDSASLHGRIGGASDRDAIRDRLEQVAVDVLTRYDGDTPERARQRLAAGTWTDDPLAAAFFGEGVDPSTSVIDRVRFAATSDSAFRQQAAHAIAELDRHVAGGR